jgi:hypothetical protein
VLAVKVAVARPVVPVATFPKSTGRPVSGVMAGRPKASSLPSRVPTKTRPPAAAGAANLDAVRWISCQAKSRISGPGTAKDGNEDTSGD